MTTSLRIWRWERFSPPPPPNCFDNERILFTFVCKYPNRPLGYHCFPRALPLGFCFHFVHSIMTMPSIGSIFNPLVGKFSGHTPEKSNRHKRSRETFACYWLGQSNSDQSEPCRSDLKTNGGNTMTLRQKCINFLMDLKLYQWLAMV